MNYRLATKSDLKELKKMYINVTNNMITRKINNWDDVYPCEFLEQDIINKELYILTNHNEIISAFTLKNNHPNENDINWSNANANALYLERFCVNVKYQNKGIGIYTLCVAKKIALKQGFQYLRLFVVDKNIPAIQLYNKCHFKKLEDFRIEYIDENLILKEYAYDLKLL